MRSLDVISISGAVVIDQNVYSATLRLFCLVCACFAAGVKLLSAWPSADNAASILEFHYRVFEYSSTVRFDYIGIGFRPPLQGTE